MQYLKNIFHFCRNWQNVSFAIVIILLSTTSLDVHAEFVPDYQIDSLNNVLQSDTITKEQLGNTYIKIAKRYDQLENTKESIDLFEKALKIFTETDDNLNKIHVLIEPGNGCVEH